MKKQLSNSQPLLSQQEIHNCKDISSKSIYFFFQEGSSVTGKKVLLVGESLAKNGWVESGKAFYTLEGRLVPTGKRLQEELSILNLTLEECAFTEIAKCYIGKNRKILSQCGMSCADHFISQLTFFKPRIIISLGVVTKDILEKILRVTLPMGAMTKVIHKDGVYHILPIYHPSPANPFGHSKNTVIMNEQKNVLKNSIES